MWGSDRLLKLWLLSLIPLPPIDEHCVPLNFLAMLQPPSHLGVLVLMICCAVGILCEIDMKAFRLLGIVIVCCAK
jgi:hypothetical protein